MAGRRAGLLGQIHRLWGLGTFAGLTDAQLLARFAAGQQDGAELAFEALVERHGLMVFRTCRGVLRDEHAAEDAFQATTTLTIEETANWPPTSTRSRPRSTGSSSSV